MIVVQQWNTNRRSTSHFLAGARLNNIHLAIFAQSAETRNHYLTMCMLLIKIHNHSKRETSFEKYQTIFCARREALRRLQHIHITGQGA